MSKLKVKTVVKHVVDDYDLQEFIEEHYNRYVELMAEYEWNFNCYYDFEAIKRPITEMEHQKIESFKEKGYFTYDTLELLLTDMCNDGLIETGTYSIYTDH